MDNASLLRKVIGHDLIVPDFESFADQLDEIFEATMDYRGGNVAAYIPELACVDPEEFAVSVCTVDGQRWSAGNVDSIFCAQSCSKVCLCRDDYPIHTGTQCNPTLPTSV